MSFWKLVSAIVVGNLLTGLVAMILWLLFIASLFSGGFNVAADVEPPSAMDAAKCAENGYQAGDPACGY